MKSENEPILFEYLDGPVGFIGRYCTPEETARLVELHDQLLAKPDAGRVDPQLIYPAREPGEAGAAIARIISPMDPPYGPSVPRRAVAALFCCGHTPGTPLADSLAIGREVRGWVFLDAEDGRLWGEHPLHPEPTNPTHH